MHNNLFFVQNEPNNPVWCGHNPRITIIDGSPHMSLVLPHIIAMWWRTLIVILNLTPIGTQQAILQLFCSNNLWLILVPIDLNVTLRSHL